MHRLNQDFRYALRQLRRSPGFAATVILTLALSVGANAVVFSILNTLILHPLNLPEFDRLAFLNRMGATTGTSALSPSQSYPDYRDLRDKTTVFSGLAAYSANRVGVDYQGSATKSWFYMASENYFDTIGIQPALGRFFHPSDAHGPNSAPYAVLNYSYWQSRFNGDPAIIGKIIGLNKHPYTILGVAPKDFQGTELFLWPDLWVPISNQQQLVGYDFLEQRGDHNIWVTGRLKPGITVAQAQANVNSVAAQMAAQNKLQDEDLHFSLSHPGFVGEFIGGPVRSFLLAVMLLAGLVLLAACANLASLFAARASDRAREMAVRLALGSTRAFLLRQLITEALVLSLLGGAAGVFLANLVAQALTNWHPAGGFPVHVLVASGWRVYLLAFALSLASGVFFGLVPAMQVWRNNAYQVIKSGTTPASGRRFSFRDVLLALQIVICSVLVASSLVAVRGLIRSFHTAFGFQPDGATMASFDLRMAGYSYDQAYQFQRRLLDSVQQLPGVKSAGVADTTPLAVDTTDSIFYREGTTDFRNSNMAADAFVYDVTPGYLATAQTSLLAGRDFTWHDDEHAPKVAIVNATFARQVFGTTQAIGRYFLGSPKNRYQVIGIVEDGKYRSLTEETSAAIFIPMAQDLDRRTVLVVRSGTDPSQITAAIQRTIKGMDSGLPFTISSWGESLSVALFPSIAATFALGIMGLLAAMLAVTGIFGMASYSVSRRLRELGIRVALGAQRRQVLKAALGRPAQLLLFGSIGGLLLGLAAGRLLAHVVYQATARDPFVLIGVLISMACIGFVAAWIPARRALAVEPSILLREQ